MKRIVCIGAISALSALLVACGSSVKLDEVPVQDISGKVVTPGSGGASSTGGSGTGTGVGSGVVNKTDVTPVAANNTNAAQDAAALAGARIVYFDYDSFAIRPEFQAVIETQARYLKSDKARKMTIEGHTDERGGREYNLALGQKRSEAVRRAIGLLGASDAQVEAVSFGKEKPAASGNDESSLAKNRRAEITYR